MLTSTKDYKELLKCLFLYHTAFKKEGDLILKGEKVITMIKLSPAEPSQSPPQLPWASVLLRRLTGGLLRVGVSGLGDVSLGSARSQQLQGLVNLCSSCSLLFPFPVNGSQDNWRNTSWDMINYLRGSCLFLMLNIKRTTDIASIPVKMHGF